MDREVDTGWTHVLTDDQCLGIEQVVVSAMLYGEKPGGKPKLLGEAWVE